MGRVKVRPVIVSFRRLGGRAVQLIRGHFAGNSTHVVQLTIHGHRRSLSWPVEEHEQFPLQRDRASR